MRGVTIALVGVLVATGCGAQPIDERPSLEEVAAATSARSYRYELTMKGEDVATELDATATGSADPRAGAGTVTYEFVGDHDDHRIEVRHVDEQTYVHFSAPGFPGGWMRENEPGLDAVLGPFGAFSEPHRAASVLARHARDVDVVPGGELDGVPTTHFRARIPTIELFAGTATEEARRELEREIRETRSEHADVEAWAGPDAVLRKLVTSIPIHEEGRDGRLVTSTVFFDFGVEVDVMAPAVSESPELQPPSDGPCEGRASPHHAQDVAAAFRAAGFEVEVSCLGDTSFVEATGADPDVPAVCSVSQRPVPEQVGGEDIVAGNVVCGIVSDADRASVRALLARL